MTNDYERYNFWHSELDEFLKKEKEQIAKYNHDVDKAVKDVRDGKSIPHDVVMNEMKNW